MIFTDNDEAECSDCEFICSMEWTWDVDGEPQKKSYDIWVHDGTYLTCIWRFGTYMGDYGTTQLMRPSMVCYSGSENGDRFHEEVRHIVMEHLTRKNSGLTR